MLLVKTRAGARAAHPTRHCKPCLARGRVRPYSIKLSDTFPRPDSVLQTVLKTWAGALAAHQARAIASPVWPRVESGPGIIGGMDQGPRASRNCCIFTGHHLLEAAAALSGGCSLPLTGAGRAQLWRLWRAPYSFICFVVISWFWLLYKIGPRFRWLRIVAESFSHTQTRPGARSLRGFDEKKGKKYSMPMPGHGSIYHLLAV